MFAHLKGFVEDISTDHVVLDVNGVGYCVMASRLTLSNLHQGNATKLYIETLMRQESLQLFGFFTKDELMWFRLLLNVQGVGPKVALNIMGSLGLSDLHNAIASQDKTSLSRADGVGPKLAARLLLELKEKIGGLTHLSDQPEAGGVSMRGLENTAMNDAILALCQLGYSRMEAVRALSSIELDPIATDTATLIRTALQQMRV